MDTTQQKDTNQNIWVKPIGLMQGCRYVHDDIFYDCWSGGFRFICIVFHHYIEKYSIYKQDLCFSPCCIYFVRGSWIHAYVIVYISASLHKSNRFYSNVLIRVLLLCCVHMSIILLFVRKLNEIWKE
jgi:hypothetical protein